MNVESRLRKQDQKGQRRVLTTAHLNSSHIFDHSLFQVLRRSHPFLSFFHIPVILWIRTAGSGFGCFFSTRSWSATSFSLASRSYRPQRAPSCRCNSGKTSAREPGGLRFRRLQVSKGVWSRDDIEIDTRCCPDMFSWCHSKIKLLRYIWNI